MARRTSTLMSERRREGKGGREGVRERQKESFHNSGE